MKPLRVLFGGIYNYSRVGDEFNNSTGCPLIFKDLAQIVRQDRPGCCIGGDSTQCLYGEFFETFSGGIGIDCWADNSMLLSSGAKDISKWEQGRLLTEEGLDASLDIFKRTFDQSLDGTPPVVRSTTPIEWKSQHYGVNLVTPHGFGPWYRG